VNADLRLESGQKVTLSYPRDVAKQQLSYAAMYGVQ
jgi:hypothetical protein